MQRASQRISHLTIAVAIAIALLNGLLGCGPTDSPARPSFDALEPYPHGSWRLARPALTDVVVTISHIVVSYDRGPLSEEEEAALATRPPGFELEPSTKRDRPAALALAKQIAAELHAEPKRFEELARKHSDDLASAREGGSLGTMSAVDLFPELLDAVAVMKPNQVSRVIETDLGFQILKLRETPPEQTVAASQIVIGYQGTESFDPRPGRALTRTRAEAEKLAREIARAAKAAPERFEELLQEHTDHADVLRDGDIGVWSTYRSTPMYREVEAISQLDVGEVSEPLDTSLGFRIFLRKPVTQRTTFAVTGIHVPFLDPPTPPAPLRSDAETEARALRLELDEDPSRLFAMQKKHCCAGIDSWEEGRGVASVEHAVSSLAIGEISQLIDVGDAFRIVQRVEAPPKRVLKPVRFDLPTTAEPDFEQLVRAASDSRVLSAYIGELEQLAKKHATGLAAESQALLTDMFAQLRTDMRNDDPERRVSALREFRSELRALLGTRAADALRKVILERVTADIAPELAHAGLLAPELAREELRP